MKTHFSFHAFERVKGRISMMAKELESILDFDLVLDIGQENNNNRMHKLFYSKKDCMCFVAVQDIKTGTVITILPLDYHENIAWAVSLEAQNQAQSILTGRKPPTCPSLPLKNPPQQTQVFRISATIVDHFGGYQKTINLGSWPHSIYKDNVAALIKDEEFILDLDTKIKEKSSHYDKATSFISNISIRTNKTSTPIVLGIQTLQGKVKIEHSE